MIWLIEAYTNVRDFFEAGGKVLLGVFIATIFMWTLIVERFWYFRFEYPRRFQEILATWEARKDQTSWYAKRIREKLISEMSLEIYRNVGMIKTFIAVAPLFGLLGTVTGMIQVFDAMASLGTSNARAMASGVSAATLPTMAGMVAALSGIYFAAMFERKARQGVEQLEDSLRHH